MKEYISKAIKFDSWYRIRCAAVEKKTYGCGIDSWK